VIPGWLFQTTRFVAARALRSERRARLGTKDRDAILLHYVNGCSMREVGAALGVSEEAAKKRVTRAIEKLRTLLARRGAAISSSVIVGALAIGGQAAVPPAVLNAIMTSVGGTATSGSAINKCIFPMA
jgi:hypothetical protein